MRRKPAGRLAVVALGLLAVVAAARGVTAQEKPASDENWKPEKLTNLKVLPKETTPNRIDDHEGLRRVPQRRLVACHKGKVDAPLSTFDFADDGKENKDVTRSMIAMTRDINTKYPDGMPEASRRNRWLPARPAIAGTVTPKRSCRPSPRAPAPNRPPPRGSEPRGRTARGPRFSA